MKKTKPIKKSNKLIPLLAILVIVSLGISGLTHLFNFEPSPARASESFTEDFSTTTYKDSENTTANWDTAEGGMISLSGVLEEQVTSALGDQIGPSGTNAVEGKVLWQDYRNGNNDIYMCDPALDGSSGGCLSGDTKTQITSNASSQMHPQIYGNYIVWRDDRNGNADIYMCNLSNNGEPGGCLPGDTKTQVTSSASNQFYPQLFDNYIVWEDHRNEGADIYMCNLSNNGEPGGCLSGDTKIQVTSHVSNQLKPKIYEGYVIWADERAGGDDMNIWMCNISNNGEIGGCLSGDTKTQVTSDPGFQYIPEIYDNYIVWSDDRNGNYDIYRCDLTLNGEAGGCLSGDSKTRVTTDSGSQSWPDVNSSYIIYSSGDSVYMCDLSKNGSPGGCLSGDSKTLLSSYSSAKANHSIVGEYVYWDDAREGEGDFNIYRSSLTALERLVQSTNINSSSSNITSATLTAIDTTPGEARITYSLSNDGGSTWEVVNSGEVHTFATSGSDLRWKAQLAINSMSENPTITSLSIAYDLATSSRRRRLDLISPDTVSDVALSPYIDPETPDEYHNAIKLTWTNPDNDDLDTISIYRSTIEGSIPNEPIASISADQSSEYIDLGPDDQGLEMDTPYYYSFSTTDASGNTNNDQTQYSLVITTDDTEEGDAPQDNQQDNNSPASSDTITDEELEQIEDTQDEASAETANEASFLFPGNRNLELERTWIGYFGAFFGRHPETTKEWKFVAYGAYDYQPLKRSLAKEGTALTKFIKKFTRLPKDAFDWQVVKALAYCGVDLDLVVKTW